MVDCKVAKCPRTIPQGYESRQLKGPRSHSECRDLQAMGERTGYRVCKDGQNYKLLWNPNAARRQVPGQQSASVPMPTNDPLEIPLPMDKPKRVAKPKLESSWYGRHKKKVWAAIIAIVGGVALALAIWRLRRDGDDDGNAGTGSGTGDGNGVTRRSTGPSNSALRSLLVAKYGERARATEDEDADASSSRHPWMNPLMPPTPFGAAVVSGAGISLGAAFVR